MIPAKSLKCEGKVNGLSRDETFIDGIFYIKLPVLAISLLLCAFFPSISLPISSL